MKVLLATVLAASFVAASTPVAAKGGPLSSKYYVKLGPSEYSLKKNQIIAKANTVSTGAAYGLGFWILPVKTVSKWSSILHKGRQNNERGPAALFYPGLTRIHFRMATQRNFNDGCDPNAALALKRWSHVFIQVAKGTAQVYVNGKLDNTCKIGPLLKPNTAQVYSGSPWNLPAAARLRNVRLYKKNLNALAIIKEMNATKTVSRPPLKGKKTQ